MLANPILTLVARTLSEAWVVVSLHQTREEAEREIANDYRH